MIDFTSFNPNIRHTVDPNTAVEATTGLFAVPLDRRLSRVRQSIATIATLASEIAVLHGSQKDFSSNQKESLSLFPASADLRTRSLPEQDRQRVASANFNFNALLDDHTLNLTNVHAELDQGVLHQFEILLGKNGEPCQALLHGYLEDDVEFADIQQQNYAVEIDPSSKNSEITYVDSETMSAILSSILYKQESHVEPDMTIAGKVQQLLDLMPKLHIDESATYEMKPRADATSAIFRLARRGIVLAGEESINAWSVGSEEHFEPRKGVDMMLGMSLSYVAGQKPEYSAALAASVTDYQGQMAEANRAALVMSAYETYALTPEAGVSQRGGRRIPRLYRDLSGIAFRLLRQGPR